MEWTVCLGKQSHPVPVCHVLSLKSMTDMDTSSLGVNMYKCKKSRNTPSAQRQDGNKGSFIQTAPTSRQPEAKSFIAIMSVPGRRGLNQTSRTLRNLTGHERGLTRIKASPDFMTHSRVCIFLFRCRLWPSTEPQRAPIPGNFPTNYGLYGV